MQQLVGAGSSTGAQQQGLSSPVCAHIETGASVLESKTRVRRAIAG
jgi:hypothetical protein